MDGPLGAGKTLFTAALCEALGVAPGEVDSPSFVLLNEYAGAPFPLFHFDAYRLEGDEEELADAGFFDERLSEGVCLVEWAERLAAYLPSGALRLRFEITGEFTRRLHFAGWTAERLAVLA
jgi:tRNA threonylcarbamoyladenosine biosynthesis protein TsaE